MLDETVKAALTDAVIAQVKAIAPGVNLRQMYGGCVFELEPDVPKSRIGGVYAYRDHITVEFAKGAHLDDPYAVLEGGGKLRRHIKLRRLADVTDTHVCDYLDRAVSEYRRREQ